MRSRVQVSPGPPSFATRRMSSVALECCGSFLLHYIALLRMASHQVQRMTLLRYTTCVWHYTYVIENSKGYQYVGLTDDLEDHLERHNQGEILSTSKYKPWKYVNFTAFPTRIQAAKYEKYLKSGSGTTFRQNHLAPNKRRRK